MTDRSWIAASEVLDKASLSHESVYNMIRVDKDFINATVLHDKRLIIRLGIKA
jgi:hypothetical protein